MSHKHVWTRFMRPRQEEPHMKGACCDICGIAENILDELYDLKRCKSCGSKLFLLGGTTDCFYCPDCVISERQEQQWRNKYGLDWFCAPNQEEVRL